MRLWSLHPKYLDTQGLVALWREALLARAVIRGETKGYRRHPQLIRFQAHPSPLKAINLYLAEILSESRVRGYSFDCSKITAAEACSPLPVNTGQLAYEWNHLLKKLKSRSPEWYSNWREKDSPEAHPLFTLREGPTEPWERLKLFP
ncbi:MAG: pyrimidine dimer DNA glycosylase/endonuclease V [Proteobacteria bacterium]|nr:DNA lyase [Desulfobulbaceae bacterium]MBU4151819.1 pyrimidine dimer DNA glycosylase/endonuclease V [Pseudomonadota bacterium]MDP2106953.1 pyrimidine dimer DNA glycosylase/endonuclease V [Desulfobulbaceae bacterium]